MKVTNYKKLEKVEFLYPSLFAPNAEEQVKDLYAKIQKGKELLSEANAVADDLRKNILDMEKEWNNLMNVAEVTFKTEDINPIKETINIGFNFGTEINKNIH